VAVLEPIALFAAALITGQIIPLPTSEWRIDATPGGSAYSWCRFDTPRATDPRHIRLLLAPGATAFLNGSRLQSNSPGEYDVTDLLSHRQPNLLAVTGPTSPAELRVTPRVFIARHQTRMRNGQLIASIWIRNTLDNTVNAFIGIRGEGVLVEANVTVPPGVTQREELSTLVSEIPSELTVTLEKQEEAMEGAYRYEVRVVPERNR
jgi:hypothetical protein